MREGIIDCGTNTFHLLIADVLPDKTFKVIYKKNVAVKLGEGGINNDIIKQAAYERGINALKEFKQLIDEFNAETIKCYGTAALRKASNGGEFIKDICNIGINIQLIDGNKEAELIYKGVSYAVNIPDSPVLIMDIGGGSTELIIATAKGILWKQSFELGAALLLEKFKPHNPITDNEIADIRQHTEGALFPMFEFLKVNNISIFELIGSAGSFETFAEMCLHQFGNPKELEGKKTFDIRLDHYKTIHNQLLKSTIDDRRQMKGLIEMRVDMIVIASILFMFVVEKLGIKKVTLSTYALKEGMIYE